MVPFSSEATQPNVFVYTTLARYHKRYHKIFHTTGEGSMYKHYNICTGDNPLVELWDYFLYRQTSHGVIIKKQKILHIASLLCFFRHIHNSYISLSPCKRR